MYGVDNEERKERDPEAQAPHGSGKPVDLGRLLRAVWRQKWWFVLVAILSAAAGIYVGKNHVPVVYEAQAVLVWEPDGEAKVRKLYTKVDSVKLPTNLEKVRKRLGISASLQGLAGSIDVKYEPDSNVVSVTASANDKEQAAEIANTTVDVFLSHQRGLEQTRYEERVASLDKDLSKARKELERARQEYRQFREEHGIMDLPAQREEAIEDTAELRAKARMAKARFARRGGAAGRAASAMRGLSREERRRLEEARRRLERARARFSDEHPRIKALAAEVEALERDVSEKATAKKSTERQDAKRQDRLRGLLDESKERLAKLSRIDSKASTLLASVQVAQERVRKLEEALTKADDALEEADADFRVVARAQPPVYPTKSYRRYVAAAFPPAGLLLYLLLVLAWELRGLRAVTPAEIAHWGRATVIGATTWPGERTLNQLMEELVEFVPKATGETLVVGADRKHAGVAEDLAARLRLLFEFEDNWSAAPDAEIHVGNPQQGESPAAAPSGDPDGGGLQVIYADGGTTHVGRGPFPSNEVPGHAAEGHAAQGAPARAEGPAVATSSSTNLVLAREQALSVPPERRITAWYGGESGPLLRRAVRRADRALVIIRARSMSCMALRGLRARLGREDDGLAFLVVGLPRWLSHFEDRIGPVDKFWRTYHKS